MNTENTKDVAQFEIDLTGEGKGVELSLTDEENLMKCRIFTEDEFLDTVGEKYKSSYSIVRRVVINIGGKLTEYRIYVGNTARRNYFDSLKDAS